MDTKDDFFIMRVGNEDKTIIASLRSLAETNKSQSVRLAIEFVLENVHLFRHWLNSRDV